MIIKKSIIVFAISLLALSSFSCNNDNQEAIDALEAEATITNNTLSGKRLDPLTKSLSCEFIGNNLVYTYEINEDLIDWETYEKALPSMKENLKNELSSNTRFENTKKNLIKIKGKVIFRYIGSNTGKKLYIEIEF